MLYSGVLCTLEVPTVVRINLSHLETKLLINALSDYSKKMSASYVDDRSLGLLDIDSELKARFTILTDTCDTLLRKLKKGVI